MQTSNNQYLSMKELADMLRLRRGTIYRMIKEGLIPAVRLGRKMLFDSEKIPALLETVRR
jgi:excisionase family DNA binding protein